MSVLDTIIGLIAPHHCLGCNFEGGLLCPKCRSKVRGPLPICCRCAVNWELHQKCTGPPLGFVAAATTYEGLARRLVHGLKFEAKLAAAEPMADLMLRLLPLVPSDALLVPVPTVPQRRRQRGYDQAVILANRLSKRSGHAVFPALSRSGHQRQVGAGREQRLTQLNNVFRAHLPYSLQKRPLILVDDVMTTGATLEAAATALQAAGAQDIAALVFARPESLGK